MEWLESVTYHYADLLIALAPAMKPYLESMGAPEEKIAVVPIGGDPVYSLADRSIRANWRKHLGLEEQFVLVYTGSLNEYYGIDKVIEAAEKTAGIRPHVAWVFLGSGRLRHVVQNAARRLPNVRYFGSIPKDELLPYYQAADAALLTVIPAPILNSTAVPGKLYDYLACGLPIVSFTYCRGQIGALLRAANAGMVTDHYTVDSLVKTVVAMADLPEEERCTIGENGRNFVLCRMNSFAVALDALGAVAALDRTRKHAHRVPRLLRSGFHACRDAWMHRSQSIIEDLYHGEPAPVVVESFDHLANRRCESTFMDVHAVFRMPALLSSRSRASPGVALKACDVQER
jgi:glycosyltransferase involved in cell wall biosynthesis